MNCIIGTSIDPYVNLATEEYLLHHTDEEYIMLWQSREAVVAGKHQNILAEINLKQALGKGISIARRLTGGGTVFHDAGNLNFTFIRSVEPGSHAGFSTHMKPVISFLRRFGVHAEEGPHHEILANNCKVSGNAQHIHKNRVLHHGTLLFDTDLKRLEEVITRRQGGTYSDRAVRSNRMPVVNLRSLLPAEMGRQDFIHALYDHLKDFHHATPFALTQHQQADIEKLAGEKYRSWDWIYGWSPDYGLSNDIRIASFQMKFRLQTHRGRIVSFSCSSGGSDPLPEDQLTSGMTGIRHEPSAIGKALKDCGLDHFVSREHWEDLVYGFF